MNSMSFFLRSITFLCLIFVCGVKSEEKALIFNNETEQLEENNANIIHVIDDEYRIAACSAFLEREDHEFINQHISIAGNAIFMKSTFLEFTKEIKCDQSYKAALVYNTSTKLYETGYEMFYYEGGGAITLKCKKYSELSKVRFNNEEPPKSNNPWKHEDKKNTTFNLPEHLQRQAKLVFYWISVLSIRVEEQHRQITFTKDLINDLKQYDETIERCEDYTLGDDWEKISASYPLQPKQRFDYNYLEKTQIMPMRFFHTLSARQATCTYLNVAFIWTNIAIDQYKKVDLYLYSIYRLWTPYVNIIFGVKGTVKGLSSDKLAKLNPTDNKILQKFPIPAPEIIYRIVEFHLKGTIYNVIIIIHNFIGEVPKEDRICPVESEVHGWDEIKNQRKSGYTAPGLSYACPVTSDVLDKLKIHYGPSSPTQTFKLDDFPTEDETEEAADGRDDIMEVAELMINLHLVDVDIDQLSYRTGEFYPVLILRDDSKTDNKNFDAEDEVEAA